MKQQIKDMAVKAIDKVKSIDLITVGTIVGTAVGVIGVVILTNYLEQAAGQEAPCDDDIDLDDVDIFAG